MANSQKVIDYYRVLGVAKSADLVQIKRAYRKLAIAHHPDKHGDNAQILLINEAYATLKDSDKRAKYDRIHALHFGVVGQFVKLDTVKANLHHFERKAHQFRQMAEQYLQNNGGQVLKNAQAIFAKFSQQISQLNRQNPHAGDTFVMPKLMIDEQIAKDGGVIYFYHQNQKIRTQLPPNLAHGTQIKLIIHGVPVWFLVQIEP